MMRAENVSSVKPNFLVATDSHTLHPDLRVVPGIGAADEVVRTREVFPEPRSASCSQSLIPTSSSSQKPGTSRPAPRVSSLLSLLKYFTAFLISQNMSQAPGSRRTRVALDTDYGTSSGPTVEPAVGNLPETD